MSQLPMGNIRRATGRGNTYRRANVDKTRMLTKILANLGGGPATGELVHPTPVVDTTAEPWSTMDTTTMGDTMPRKSNAKPDISASSIICDYLANVEAGTNVGTSMEVAAKAKAPAPATQAFLSKLAATGWMEPHRIDGTRARTYVLLKSITDYPYRSMSTPSTRNRKPGYERTSIAVVIDGEIVKSAVMPYQPPASIADLLARVETAQDALIKGVEAELSKPADLSTISTDDLLAELRRRIPS